MKRFFAILVLFSVISFSYWGYTYFRKNAETRGSFAVYVHTDAVKKYQIAIKAIKDIPKLSAELVESKGHAENALLKQIESAVSAYYATEGHYPKNLSEVVNKKNLPESIAVKYTLTAEGYTVSLYNKKGELLNTVSHGN